MWLAVSLWAYICVEQMNNKIIEELYQQLGVANVFKLWWVCHGVEKVIMFFVKNLLIIIEAKRKFPEFDGYFGALYPGSEKPKLLTPCQVVTAKKIRTPTILVRSTDGVENFAFSEDEFDPPRTRQTKRVAYYLTVGETKL